MTTMYAVEPHFDHPELDGAKARQIRAKNPDELMEGISEFSPNACVSKITDDEFHASARAVRTPRTALFQIEAANIRVKWEPRADYVSITLPLEGKFKFTPTSEIIEIGPDTAYIVKPGFSGDLQSSGSCACLVLNISERLLNEAMSSDTAIGRKKNIEEIANLISLKDGEGAALFRLVSFYWSEFLLTSALWKSPKTMLSVENILANAVILAATDHNSLAPGHENLRRTNKTNAVLEFMNTNLNRPLTLSEIAAATNINSRTLTRIFQSLANLGPIAYHRQLRLQRVNLKLIAANKNEASVTDIAMEFGFYHLSHFAALYKGLFGETPSETLSR
jgi:AraC-like DNA-binding protein